MQLKLAAGQTVVSSKEPADKNILILFHLPNIKSYDSQLNSVFRKLC